MTDMSSEPTVLTQASISKFWQRKVDAALSAARFRGNATLPLTTTTRQDESEDSSATSATAHSGSSNSTKLPLKEPPDTLRESQRICCEIHRWKPTAPSHRN